jgi:phospholipid/cholesterol/gamma-HCH transport system substrate-binding protein
MNGKQRLIETSVGVFIILGIVALAFLAFKVSGLTVFSGGETYRVSAEFESIGDLEIRAPVTIAGVRVGEVSSIDLDPTTYQAMVRMHIDDGIKIPEDSTANIYTAGLIGANYISLTPGLSETYLKNRGKIERTNQALILQNVIGQLLFSLKSDSKEKSAKENTTGA